MYLNYTEAHLPWIHSSSRGSLASGAVPSGEHLLCYLEEQIPPATSLCFIPLYLWLLSSYRRTLLQLLYWSKECHDISFLFLTKPWFACKTDQLSFDLTRALSRLPSARVMSLNSNYAIISNWSGINSFIGDACDSFEILCWYLFMK